MALKYIESVRVSGRAKAFPSFSHGLQTFYYSCLLLLLRHFEDVRQAEVVVLPWYSVGDFLATTSRLRPSSSRHGPDLVLLPSSIRRSLVMLTLSHNVNSPLHSRTA